jgi:Kef-type K+ transport system membrane component KefB/predicted amino acid-binding ACT domain protein
MDLRELGAVGRASLTVAAVGVVVPFAAGLGAGLAFEMSGDETLFVAAALTATSVGITARVFGDLRALASVEARTVLGAAVADDVMGLVILTVVIRVVSQGSVSVTSLAWILIVAIGFLVLTTAVGVAVVPPLFARLERHSRSAGTLVAVALAFALALAVLADEAKLAPIVGAFVAGLILGRCRSADRIRREMAPVGHLLIPVFFLQIGIDADIAEFIHANVLRLAAALLIVAILGKLASAAGLWGSPGDKLLVGIGMIPRGEVGLVFATIGLSTGVFGQDVYAALLLVVLATTLLTPPLLRRRLLGVRAGGHPGSAAAASAPPGGWLSSADGTVELVSEPAPALRLEVALEAARACADARAGASLLSWLDALPPGPLRWTPEAQDQLVALLGNGSPRSWRLLVMSGVLERALPELGAAVAVQRSESELDPIAALYWPRLAHLQQEGLYGYRGRPEKLLAAALVVDTTDQRSTDRKRVAREVAQALGLGTEDEKSLVNMVDDAGLLLAASRRIDGLMEEPVLQLAAHLVTREQAEALYALTLSGVDELDVRDRARVTALHELLLATLTHPDLVGPAPSDTVEERRRKAALLVTDQDALERIEHAPRRYLLAMTPAEIACQALLCDPVPRGGAVRIGITPRNGGWMVDVVARDRLGLLARESGVLIEHGFDVISAIAATWGDGCALASFEVRGALEPDRTRLQDALVSALHRPVTSAPVTAVTVEFDDVGSPWHTVATVRGKDQPGLLHALTAAFAAAGADVHAARAHTVNGDVVDVFELTDVRGLKLRPDACEEVERMLAAGVVERPRRPWQRPRLGIGSRRRLRTSSAPI